MATTKEIIEGMQIISKYYKDQDGYQVDAQHDIIYMYPTDSDISEEDLARLEELGWATDREDSGDGWGIWV